MKKIAAIAMLSAGLAAFAQDVPVPAATAAASVAPPTTGLLVSYQYWPVQFVQWITDGDPLPYSMLVLEADTTGKTPVLDLALTDRKTQKRVRYSNNQALVAGAKAMGEDAYYVAMAFEWDGNFAVGNVASLRFTMHDEKPFEWHIAQGSDLSAQGSGLTALPESPIPVLAYRELGAAAGEGTGVQIGKVVSAAEVWKEISHPPFFVGYRGAVSQSAHQLVMYPGAEHWTVTSAPAKMSVGESWEMDGDHGVHRTLKIDKVSGDHYTVTGMDRRNPAIAFTLQATKMADGWTIESERFAPVKDGDKHGVTLQFAPAGFDVVVGKKTKIASAALTVTGAVTDRTTALEMKTPTWAVGKALVEETTWKDGLLVTEAKVK